jgi:hypothetical protein
VNIFGYSVGGPIVIPKLIDSRESQKRVLYFFLSQEFTHDVRPTTPVSIQPADGRRAHGRLLADARHQRRHPANHRSPDGPAIPGKHHPPDRINPMGQAILALLPLPNGVLDQSPGQSVDLE